MTQNDKRCCDYMKQSLDDNTTQIKYNPIFRSYYIPLYKNAAKQLINFCPWCGTKLPRSLRMDWFEILENEYKLDPYNDPKNVKDLPEEFKSDQWWKNRNL